MEIRGMLTGIAERRMREKWGCEHKQANIILLTS